MNKCKYCDCEVIIADEINPDICHYCWVNVYSKENA